MIRSHACRAALAATLVLALPQAIAGVELDDIGLDACRRITCETTYAASGAAVIEIRGRSPGDAGNMLDLTVYDGASYGIVYYDTLEVPPAGDFMLRIPLRRLGPGSYTFSVSPRYSGAMLGTGAFTALPRVLPHRPPWPPQGSPPDSSR